MIGFRAAAIAAVTVSAMGCAVIPDVQYHALSAGVRSDRWVLFRLTDSVIAVGKPGQAETSGGRGKDLALAPPISLNAGQAECTAGGCGPLAAAVAPTDFEGALYGIEPKSRRLVSTEISPTYQPDSLRLKNLAVEAKDHRLEAINTIGAIAAGVTKLTAGDRKAGTITLNLPITIDLADARCETGEGGPCVSAVVRDPASPSTAGAPRALPGNTGWTYTLSFLDDPHGSGLTPRSAIERIHGAMVASTCRNAILSLAPPAKADANAAIVPPQSLRIELADPDWLQTAPFPTKGSMDFHTLCGIDVVSTAGPQTGTDELASAFFRNVEAVRSAQKP